MATKKLPVVMASRRIKRYAAGLCSALVIVAFPQSGQGATVDQPLSFRSNMILTGDYVLAGGPMNGPTTNGYTTTTITIPSLPSGATAVAAYLYWGSIVQQSNPDAATDAFFQAGVRIAFDPIPTGRVRRSVPAKSASIETERGF